MNEGKSSSASLLKFAMVGDCNNNINITCTKPYLAIEGVVEVGNKSVSVSKLRKSSRWLSELLSSRLSLMASTIKVGSCEASPFSHQHHPHQHHEKGFVVTNFECDTLNSNTIDNRRNVNAVSICNNATMKMPDTRTTTSTDNDSDGNSNYGEEEDVDVVDDRYGIVNRNSHNYQQQQISLQLDGGGKEMGKMANNKEQELLGDKDDGKEDRDDDDDYDYSDDDNLSYYVNDSVNILNKKKNYNINNYYDSSGGGIQMAKLGMRMMPCPVLECDNDEEDDDLNDSDEWERELFLASHQKHNQTTMLMVNRRKFTSKKFYYSK